MAGQGSNFKILCSEFGIEWVNRLNFTLGGHKFNIPGSIEDFVNSDDDAPDVFYLSKTRDMLGGYLRQFRQRMPSRILELGVFRGGGAAFLQLAAKPQRMLALELSETPLELLDRFIETEKLTRRMHVKYGVDQADAPRLRALVAEHLGPDRSVDLVIDDASHLLGPTRTSFETVFPLLRPGASYIIEDYASSQILCNQWLEAATEGGEDAAQIVRTGLDGGLQSDQRPLHLLAVEAMLAAIAAPSLFAHVTLDKHWLHVVRGGAEVEDVENFSLADLANDQFGLLDTRLSERLQPFMPR